MRNTGGRLWGWLGVPISQIRLVSTRPGVRRHRAPWVPAFVAAAGVLTFAGIGHAQARSRPASQAPTWTISPRPNLVIDTFGDSLPLAKVEGAARLRDGSIVVADRRLNKVFYYTSNGEPQAAAGRAGAGPGEFRGILWMGQCEPDTISVYDPILARITRFSPGGELVGSRPASPQGPSGFWVRSGRSPYQLACGPRGAQGMMTWPGGALPKALGPHRGRVSIAVTASPAAPYTLIGEFPGPERYRFKTSDGPRTFGKAVHIAVSTTRIFVGTADSFAVQVFDLHARPVGTIRWNARPRRFTDEDKAAYADRATWSLASAAQQQRLRDAVNAMQFPEFLPPYDRFLVDDAERLWVQQANAPTHRRRLWWGFDAAGAMVAMLDVPREFLLLQLSATEALGTWTDDDGVESVRSFAVVRPS